MPTLFISSPHLVAALLDTADIRQNLLLMDIFGEMEGERWLAEITLIFNPVAFSRNHGITRADFYLGSTGATVTLDLQKSGEFIDWTQATGVDVENTVSKTLTRKFSIELKPELDIKTGGVKFSPGKTGMDNDKEIKQEGKYEMKEYFVEPKKAGNTVEWRIQLPKGFKAVRSFLYGNMLLTADIRWGEQAKKGMFTLRTSDIRFFDDQGEPLSKKQNLAMKYLIRPNISIQNLQGLTFNFEIHD